MASENITTSIDPVHAPTSTDAKPLHTTARDHYERVWSHFVATRARTPDRACANVIPFPLLDVMEGRLRAGWDAARAEELAEMAAGCRSEDAAQFDGDNPWVWEGHPLPIQSGVPCPPGN